MTGSWLETIDAIRRENAGKNRCNRRRQSPEWHGKTCCGRPIDSNFALRSSNASASREATSYDLMLKYPLRSSRVNIAEGTGDEPFACQFDWLCIGRVGRRTGHRPAHHGHSGVARML